MKRDRLILLMAVYALGWFILYRMPWDVLRSPIAGSDLSSYYTAGYLVRTGAAAGLYAVHDSDTILGDATGGPYRTAGDALGIGRQHYYIYPPFFALLCAPLSLLPFGTARLAWLAADLTLLAAFVTLYVGWRRHDGVPPGLMESGLIAVTLGLEFLPLIWALAIGQTSLLLLALFGGCLFLARRGREPAAGILLGLAVAIKLTPALLAVYFLWRGRARIALWAFGCFAVCTGAAAVALGPGVSVEFFARIVPGMSGGTSYFLNQSLAGFFARLAGDGDVRQVALAGSVAARALATLCALTLVGVSALRIGRTGGAPPRGLRLDLEVSLVLLLTLAISPISWSHHYVLALVPIWTIVAAGGRSGRGGPAMALAAGAAWLLIARKPHADLFLHGLRTLGNSAALYGALGLWAVCLALIGRERRDPRREAQVAHAA